MVKRGMQMGEKVYKPILDDKSHLLRSNDNPNRVRGLSRDINNQNPGIPEWEEYDLDDLTQSEHPGPSDSVNNNQLTPEQQELVAIVGIALAEITIRGGKWIYRKAVKPFWDKHCYPWLLQQKDNAVEWVRSKRNTSKNMSSTPTTSSEESYYSICDVSSQIDDVLDRMVFELTEDEYNEHLMKLVYHMLGVVNEIRIISNARISQIYAMDGMCLQKQQEAEFLLADKVAAKLNQLLSSKNLFLDINTSRELFALTGGGVWMNNEYIPVQAEKINAALKTFPTPNDNT